MVSIDPRELNAREAAANNKSIIGCTMNFNNMADEARLDKAFVDLMKNILRDQESHNEGYIVISDFINQKASN